MSCCKSWDGFARPVQFTFKNDDQFATVVGGLAGIITALLMLLYGS